MGFFGPEKRVLKGAIYHHDGTRAYRDHKVSIEVRNNNKLYEETVWSNSDGYFEIPAEVFEEVLEDNPNPDEPSIIPDREAIWLRETVFYVDGNKIKQKARNGKDKAILISPDSFGGGKNLSGGIITGVVVDKGGGGYEKRKVEARIVKSGGLTNFNSKFIESRTDKHGNFVLELDGGIQVDRLTVDGNTAERATRKAKDGSEVDVDPDQTFQAGTFGLKLTRAGKFLGIF